jgi:hypothetical protein
MYAACLPSAQIGPVRDLRVAVDTRATVKSGISAVAESSTSACAPVTARSQPLSVNSSGHVWLTIGRHKHSRRIAHMPLQHVACRRTMSAHRQRNTDGKRLIALA